MKEIFRLSAIVAASFSAMFITLGVWDFGGSAACANSGPPFWSGATGSGIYTDNCPIEVRGETLTFDVREYPSPYYESEEDYLAYEGKVTAEYTFVNPTDEEISAALYFPFGTLPDYVWSEYTGNMFRYADDTGKYGITADGVPLEVSVRHTYPSELYVGFDFVTESGKLLDDCKTYGFYTPQTPVYAYTYAMKEVDAAAENACAFTDIATDGSDMRILCDYRIRNIAEGHTEVGFYAESGREITVYAVGKPFAEDLRWKFYRNGFDKEKGECGGSAVLTGTAETTFAELLLSCRAEDSAVSEVDYYNAMVDYWIGDNTVVYFSASDDYLSKNLMRWYAYALTFAPGQTIVNTVTAPVYPTVGFDTDPFTYEYVYLVSPAAGWADFRDLEINILTDDYLLYDTQGFTKTEQGYRAYFATLPEGELIFTLSSSDSPTYIQRGTDWTFFIFIGLALFYVLPAVLILGVAVWSIVYVGRKNKNV